MPIDTSSPCGSDYKYEDSFLAIESEIDKSNSLLDDVETDWSVVLHETELLLINHTKDIKIMSWWTYAQFKTHSIIGLEKALDVFNDLILAFDDNLFPKSKKVRISSLTWLETFFNEELLDENGNLVISLDAEKFSTHIKNLQTNISKILDEEVSLFKKLQFALEKVLKEQEKKEIPYTTPESTLTTTDLTEISQINSDEDATKVLRMLKKHAGLLQKYYREKDVSDIRAIRLVRLLSWFDIDGLPAHVDGKTPLNPPSQESINTIETLIAEEEFEEALSKVENMIVNSPFWIEGHFIVFTILTDMEYTQAAQEVKNTLISFIKSNEKILELNFKDNTPFCSSKLKKWILENMDSNGTPSSNESIEVDTKVQIKEEAYVLANKNKIKEAMSLLHTQHGSAASKEEKFYWRLTKAKLATEFGKNNIALALVEDLKKDIDIHHLDEWKPELAANVYSLFLGFNRSLVDKEDINTTYTRLCKIDIKKALEIKE